MHIRCVGVVASDVEAGAQVCYLPFDGSEQCLDWLLRHDADVSAVSNDGLVSVRRYPLLPSPHVFC